MSIAGSEDAHVTLPMIGAGQTVTDHACVSVCGTATDAACAVDGQVCTLGKVCSKGAWTDSDLYVDFCPFGPSLEQGVLHWPDDDQERYLELPQV